MAAAAPTLPELDDDDASQLFGLDDPRLSFVHDHSPPSSDPPQQPSAHHLPHQTYFANPQSDWISFPTTTAPSSAAYAAAGLISPADSMPNSAWANGMLPMDAFSNDMVNFSQSDVNPAFVFGASMPPDQQQQQQQQQQMSQNSHAQGHPQSSISRSSHAHMAAPTTLTPAVQEELRNIAMPPNLRYTSPNSASSPDSALGEGKLGNLSSPDMILNGPDKGSRKRKSSDEPEDEDEEDEDGKPIKKTAHNMIEKRYRMNLNDKIAALRDSVPSLRIMSKSVRGEDTTGDREELHGLTPAHKLNKATVLSKATEYIRHLEKRNNRLLDENNAMHARIAAFEKLFMAGAMNGSIPQQQPPTPMQYAHDTHSHGVNSPMPLQQDGSPSAPVGMIQVPDDMKRILSAQMAVGRPYPVPEQAYYSQGPNTRVLQQQHIQQQKQMPQSRWANVSPYYGKLMVGSLAGLMILEAVREDEMSPETPEGRGLFAVPIHLLGRMAGGLDFRLMGYHVHTSLKLLLVLGSFLWLFVPSLFSSSDSNTKKPELAALRPLPSLASSIHIRRQAWLTSIQTVWVPRHNFFLEAAALLLKTAKLSMRNAIGMHGYQMITGLTEEQETARVKAWSIALDSQLAGGDVEINGSRLLLTLLASGTLPDTPIRLMLKALHIRVILWDLSRNNLQMRATNALAAKLARARWNEARSINRILAQLRRDSSEQHEDELPEHLATLVELDCDDVLNADVIQRAHNLAFNRETTYNVEQHIDGMDAVVDDLALGTPMDAVAAWWSTGALHAILTDVLARDDESEQTTAADINLAIQAAPIGSVARVRAVVARALLIEQQRGANIASALEAVGTGKAESPLSRSTSIIEETSFLGSPDLRLALRCAMAIAHLRRLGDTKMAPQQKLVRLVDSIMTPNVVSSMSLLGCTAAFQLMEVLFEHKDASGQFGLSLERLSGNLRLWMGGPSGNERGVDAEVRHKVVDRCLDITKNLVGMEVDTGYGTLSEGEHEQE